MSEGFGAVAFALIYLKEKIQLFIVKSPGRNCLESEQI
jgi:hypothetical protein